MQDLVILIYTHSNQEKVAVQRCLHHLIMVIVYVIHLIQWGVPKNGKQSEVHAKVKSDRYGASKLEGCTLYY